ncbi:MAG: outer membrane protein assembly factor BamE [Pseudomonadota bacterium]
MHKYTIIFSILFSTFLLSSCQTIDSRGQYIDDSQLKVIENKTMTKNEVISMLGSPTLIPDYSPDVWYYASRSMRRSAWFKPKVTAQRIIQITFESDKIAEVEVLNESHQEGIKVIKEYTKSLGNDQNPLQHFVHNLGRFNKPINPKKHRYTKQTKP